jgi:hypothetical protein
LSLIGTIEQKKDFYEYRRCYIENLLNKFCVDKCIFKIIGSESIVSDIDVSMSQDYEFIVKNNAENNINYYDSYKKIINQYNLEYPNQSLEELFDTNFYLTSFIYLIKNNIENELMNSPNSMIIGKIYKPDETQMTTMFFLKQEDNNIQRQWSFFRLCRILEEKNLTYMIFFIFEYLKLDSLKILYINTYNNFKKYFDNNWKKDINIYINLIVYYNEQILNLQKSELKESETFHYINVPFINEMFGSENKELIITDKLINLMSLATSYEDDSYHTLACFLRWSGSKYEELENNHIINCIYENLGFAVDFFLRSNFHCRDINFNLSKVAKYLERICLDMERICLDIELINIKDKDVIKDKIMFERMFEKITIIKKTCETINNSRKIDDINNIKTHNLILEELLQDFFTTIILPKYNIDKNITASVVGSKLFNQLFNQQFNNKEIQKNFFEKHEKHLILINILMFVFFCVKEICIILKIIILKIPYGVDSKLSIGGKKNLIKNAKK